MTTTGPVHASEIGAAAALWRVAASGQGEAVSMLVSTAFSMRNALIGLIVATALAISLSGTTIFGIDAWKIALAAAGAVLFVAGSDRRAKGRR